MAFDNSDAKAVWAAWLGTTPKKVWTATFLCRNSTSRTAFERSQSRTLEYAVSAGFAKRSKITALLIFSQENRKILLDWALWCASRGIDNFLNSSFKCHMSEESYRLAEFKYAIFVRTGRKTKKLWRSELFLWTVFKHGLLEGSTILLKYSAITRIPLESSPLGELKYAISAGWDVRPKTKSIRKCKKWHCAMSVHGHCILDRFRQDQTGSDRFGQVRTGVKRHFFPQPWVARCPNLAHPPNQCAVF